MDFKNIQPKSDALKCPRCHSIHTKFCYYNNYNYSQPRHFCKTCRRYWTLGGLLRNVPVGGGTRKSKKISKPKPAILSDSPSNPKSAVLLGSDLEMFSTPLKLNQAGDWYDWIKNGREFESGIVAATGDPTAEGFGSLDQLVTSGGNEISGGVAFDGGWWFGLRPPFNK